MIVLKIFILQHIIWYYHCLFVKDIKQVISDDTVPGNETVETFRGATIFTVQVSI